MDLERIPKTDEIEKFIEFRKFYETFIPALEQTFKENKKVITFNFEDYKFKEYILSFLIGKGYSIQYMKFKQMYAISLE